MNKYKYINEHNNYGFELNEIYEGFNFSDNWIMIEGQLYRKQCFELLEREK